MIRAPAFPLDSDFESSGEKVGDASRRVGSRASRGASCAPAPNGGERMRRG